MKKLAAAALVLAAGCGIVAEDVTAPMAETITATTTTAAQRIVVEDDYWSVDRETYFVVVSGVERHRYCEVHLTLNGRRTGDWGNEVWDGTRSRVTISVGYVQHDADGFEVECS